MLIEFDPNKDRANLEKHGISISIAAQIDNDAVVSFTDPRPYDGEVRHIGYTPIEGQLYTFWFTWRGDICRVIGIRKASNKEVIFYYEQQH